MSKHFFQTKNKKHLPKEPLYLKVKNLNLNAGGVVPIFLIVSLLKKKKDE